MPLHYEKIIEETLRSVSKGPWTDEDLTRAREAITDDICRIHGPECTGAAVTDWFDSLDDAQREDLLFRVNADWNEGLEPWALG